MRGILVTIIALVLFGATAILMWLREKKRTDEITGELDTYFSRLKERRTTIRLNKRLSVVCKVVEKSDSHWSVFSKDISGEGICLYMPEILPQDAIVDLKIDIPGKKYISVHGKVVWVKETARASAEGKRQFNSGIKFIKIRPKDKDDLVDFIETSLKSKNKNRC